MKLRPKILILTTKFSACSAKFDIGIENLNFNFLLNALNSAARAIKQAAKRSGESFVHTVNLFWPAAVCLVWLWLALDLISVQISFNFFFAIAFAFFVELWDVCHASMARICACLCNKPYKVNNNDILAGHQLTTMCPKRLLNMVMGLRAGFIWACYTKRLHAHSLPLAQSLSLSLCDYLISKFSLSTLYAWLWWLTKTQAHYTYPR